MAPHSSTLAWKIPWMEEPGRLQSMGSLRVRHDWVISLSLFIFMHWEGNGNPLQCSCLENPRDGGAWWAAIYGVTQSWTQLKWLSSSSIPLLEWPKFKILKTSNPGKIWSNRNSHSSPVGMQNHTATLVDSLIVYFRTKCTLDSQFKNCTLRYLTK